MAEFEGSLNDLAKANTQSTSPAYDSSDQTIPIALSGKKLNEEPQLILPGKLSNSKHLFQQNLKLKDIFRKYKTITIKLGLTTKADVTNKEITLEDPANLEDLIHELGHFTDPPDEFKQIIQKIREDAELTKKLTIAYQGLKKTTDDKRHQTLPTCIPWTIS